MSAAIWLTPALVPLLMLAGMAWPAFRARVHRAAPAAALPALAVALFGPAGSAELPWLLLGARVGLDHPGRVLLGTGALIWLLAAAFAGREIRDPSAARFFACFLASMSGSLGLAVALDAGSFQLCYALMGFSAYGLVAHQRTQAARRAGRLYLALVVIGEIAVFVGASLLYRAAGTAAFPALATATLDAAAGGAALALLLGGFAIKSGIIPFHVWMPPAYAAAPIAGAAALGGAMINAGLLGWLRFLPLGAAQSPGLGTLIIGLGLGSALYGVVIGVLQRDPRAVLAYSSVSQMGLLGVGLGVALLAPASWPSVRTGLLLYATHHALSKGALLLGAGVAPGAGRTARRRLVLAGLAVPALALAGAPGTTGATAKEALKQAAALLHQPLAEGVGMLLPVAAVGTALLMARALLLMASPGSGIPGHDAQGIRWWPFLALSSAVTTGVWWLPRVVGWSDTPSFESLLAAAWPVAAGGLVAATAAWASKVGWLKRWPEVPPGDLWVPIERAMAAWGGRGVPGSSGC